MKRALRLVWAVALGLSAPALRAQETNQVQQLREQLRQLQESFEKTQQQYRQQDRGVAEAD